VCEIGKNQSGVNQQSNILAQKVPARDAGKHVMSGETLDISGETATPSTETRSSAEVVSTLLEESDVMETEGSARDPMSTAQSYQLFASLQNISSDMPEEAIGSGNKRDDEPEITVVSYV
jgi:histone deacetylase complex regulatory component SIN3